MALAIIRATNLVLRAPNRAVGGVNTLDLALFLVELPAPVACVIADAQNRLNVVTSVRVSVEKTVHLRNSVTNVAMTT